MKKNAVLVKNKLFLSIIFLIYVILTFILMLNHVPFWDEARAFSVSSLNFFQTLELAKIDGHTILWYLLLKPFNSINFYPISMKLINWIFAIIASFIFFKKSSFSLLNKILILFSVPFFLYFPIVARGYCLAILFLFLVCIFYKNRFKTPYLFALLLIISANIEIVSSIPCFYIGLIYLFELFKKKDFKLLRNVFLIFLFGALVLILQMFFTKGENLVQIYSSWKTNYYFSFKVLLFNIPALIYHIFGFLILVYFLIYSLINNKKALFFLLGTNLTLFLMFSIVYCGCIWNYYFYFVYFILAFWLFFSEFQNKKIIGKIFSTYLFLSCVPFLVNYIKTDTYVMYNSPAKNIAKYFSQNPKYTNAKLYCFDWWSDISPSSDIYLAQNNIAIYDFDNLNRRSFESMKRVYQNRNRKFDFDKFYNELDFSKENYIITSGQFLNQSILSDGKIFGNLIEDKIHFFDEDKISKVVVFKIVKK